MQIPFSLYHGWTVVLVVLSGFEAFGTDAQKYKPDTLTKALVFAALFFLEATGAGYAFYNTDGDLAGSSVITWTLWGIYDNQKNGGSSGIQMVTQPDVRYPARFHSILCAWFCCTFIHLGDQGSSCSL